MTSNSDLHFKLQKFKVTPKINFETLSYNPFSAEAILNDNCQNPDINFDQGNIVSNR